METGEPRQTTEAAVKESATAVAVASATTATSSSSIPNNVDDAESATDEVKVYGEEDGDERETKAFEGGQARDPLLDDKSTLLTESEQSKDARRHDLTHSLGRLFDPALSSLGIHDYILRAAMNHQAANAYAFSLAGRPWFGENALTSPGSTGAHTGLRPPLYHLPPPPPHGQYPYPMISDQLAYMHHQAAAYQQAGALRAGSPYSLPITSGSMSRFSPGGLLGHPGLSPASNGGPHLPHIKADLDSSSSNHRPSHNNHRGGEKESKKKENHIKKPLNAFMLYMKEMRPVVQAECTLKESAAINQILGRRWHDLSREEQAKYYEKARSERQKHMEMYPHWNARDNYRFGLKKKKRKREKGDDPAASMKKCRARYGLDQQEHWCRPCRRKKKCIRVQAYMDSNMGKANNGGGAMAGSGGISSGGAVQGGGPSAISENGATGNNQHPHKWSQKSRSDDEDEDDDDEDHSPDSRSLGSTSEQSLTSPAGFSSLNSLGSPASIASPSTPSQFEAVVSQADLFRPSSTYGGGAFKPPSASTSGGSGGGGLAAQHQLMMQQQQQQQQHHQQQLSHQHFLQQQQQHMFPHLNLRPPVGTDPRDKNHPFSISQLTGKVSASGHPLGGPQVGTPLIHAP